MFPYGPDRATRGSSGPFGRFVVPLKVFLMILGAALVHATAIAL